MQLQFVYKELEDGRQVLYAWFSAMHSRVDLILCNQPEAKLKAIAVEISDKLAAIEQMGDYHNASSELYKVNETASREPIRISNELLDIISDFKEQGKATCGCFDIAIQSEHYHQGMMDAIELSVNDSTIFFREEGIRLDMSGYLKGYGLEQAKEILKNHSIDHALINIGNSSVMAIGNHPYGKGWKVSETDRKKEVTLFDECLTTSGNNCKERRHIINPQTGKTIEGKREISVVTAKGTDGEILSTALFAADAEQFQTILHSNKHKLWLHEETF